MHTKPDPVDPDALNEMGYDRRDIDVSLIKKATFWISLSCIVCYIVGLGTYNIITSRSLFYKPHEEVKSKVHIKAGDPILQDNITAHVDISRMRYAEDEALSKPTWIDQSKGTVRVPIARAMEIVAQNGVSTGQAVEAKTIGNTIPMNAEGPKAQ